MRVAEHARILDAQADQRRHVEEPAVAEIPARGAPPGEPIDLSLQEPVDSLDVRVGRRDHRFERVADDPLCRQGLQPCRQHAHVAVVPGDRARHRPDRPAAGRRPHRRGTRAPPTTPAPPRCAAARPVTARRPAAVARGTGRRTRPHPRSSRSSPRLQDPSVVVAQDGHQDAVSKMRAPDGPIRHRSDPRSGWRGRSASTSHHHGFAGPIAMWLGTMSSTTPSPAACAAAQRRAKATSPPSAASTCRGSTTS